MNDRLIYLDNSATTKISPEALSVYREVSENCFGNPSSLHKMGSEAEKIIRGAKEILINSLCAKGYRVVFSSSGSEANNLAITGRALSKERYRKGAKIITTDGEHASVNAPLDALKAQGFKIVKISTRGGEIDMDKLREEMTSDVILVTMMMVNNETGALYDLKKVSEIMKRQSPEALLHIDATQSFMKEAKNG